VLLRILAEVFVESRLVIVDIGRCFQDGVKFFRNAQRFLFVVIFAERCIAAGDIPLHVFQQGRAGKPVDLPGSVARSPVDFFLQALDYLSRELDVAGAYFAVFERIEILLIDLQLREIDNAWRIAEFLNDRD